MKKLLILPVFLLINVLNIFCQPTIWKSSGIGGGGAFFAPSINPGNDDEFYVSSDMSDLFHTTDFGLNYKIINFTKLEGGHYSCMQWTNNPNILYCIDHTEQTPGYCPLPVKSTDGGNSWSVLSGDPDLTETTYSIFADYSNPSRVLISFYSSVWFSDNGGSSFIKVHTATDLGSGVVVGGVFFDGNNIYIGTNDGLLFSINGGSSFTLSSATGIPSTEGIFSFSGAKNGSVTRLVCLTGNKTDIYTGKTGSDYYDFIKGVYTLDVGGNWISKMIGINISQDFLMFTGMAWNDINTIYLGGSSSAGRPNVMKSIDGGNSWTHILNTTGNQNIATGWAGDSGDHAWSFPESLFGMAVAPYNSGKVIITDYSCVHKTSDGGTSWQQAYLSAADQNPAGFATPKKKTYHGISLENTSVWQIYWFDSLNVFGAFTDISGIRSTDGGKSWSYNYTGHSANTMYRVVKNISSSTVYAATSDIHDLYQSTRLADAQLDANDNNGKIIYTNDKGASWQTLHSFGHPVFWVAVDPSNPNRLYASMVHHTLGGIYVSDDIQNGSSSNWSKLANPPRTEGHPASIVVLKDGKMVCTYSGRRAPGFTASSGVFIYNPVNSSWTDVSDPGMYYWTKDIIVDPFDTSQNTWYIGVFSGWGGAPNGLGGLYRTTNRGQTWTRISKLDRVTSCTFNPGNEDELYVTTEQNGLWFSGNIRSASPSFLQVSSYPFKQPERVFVNPFKAGEIWVSSTGCGIMIGTSGTSGSENTGKISPDVILYPNPNHGCFYIDPGSMEGKEYEIMIFDQSGKMVIHKINFGEKINIVNLCNGIYCCLIRSKNNYKTLKFIVN